MLLSVHFKHATRPYGGQRTGPRPKAVVRQEAPPLVQAAQPVNQSRRKNRLWLASLVWHAMGMAMRSPFAVSVLVLTALSLTACAADTANYPSLARRPAERWSENPPAPVPSTPASAPALDQAALDRIDSLLGQARSADASFRQHAERTRALVGAASGAAVASEAWSVATVAVSDLESSRSQAMIALDELDTLYAAQTVLGNDAAPLKAARDQVIAMVSEEDAVLSGLKDKLAN